MKETLPLFGATTLEIMTLGIMTPSTMSLGIMSFSITTQTHLTIKPIIVKRL